MLGVRSRSAAMRGDDRIGAIRFAIAPYTPADTIKNTLGNHSMAGQPAIHTRALAIGGLIAMAAAVGIGRFIYTPILPPMTEELDLSKGQAGLIAGANFAGYLAGALAAASPRLPGNMRSWMVWSLAASALTTAAMGLASGLAWFLVLRFIGGAASAFVLVLASTLVLERLSAAGRGDLAAWHFAGVGAGITISALLVEALHSLDSDWRWMWLGGGIISLVAVLAVGALVPDATGPGTASVRAPGTAASPRLKPLIIAYGLFGFGYVITATFIVAIVRGSPDARPLEYMIWLVFGLSAIPSVAAWSAVARRYGVLRAFALACLVEAIGVFASVVWLSVAGLLIAAAFLGGTFMGLTALGLMAARSLAQGDARRAFAGMTAAFGLGQAIGPVAAGYGFDLTGSFLVPSLVAAIGLCIAMALALNLGRSGASP
jgi:predicted MFS family arabinose efflux permease